MVENECWADLFLSTLRQRWDEVVFSTTTFPAVWYSNWKIQKIQKVWIMYVTTKIFTIEENKTIKTIFYLTQACIFGIFQHSNIRNESETVNKNYFIFYTKYISVKLSKISEWPHPFSKTVSGQKNYFA